MSEMHKETPAIAQEKQQALLLLRGQLSDEDNFVVLQWGPAAVKWPDPARLKEVLSAHTGATYRALLHDLEDGKDSRQLRGLISFFLQILSYEELTDKME